MDGGGQCTLGVWAEIYGNTRFTSEVLLNAMNEGLSAERNVYLYSALNAYTDRYIHPSYQYDNETTSCMPYQNKPQPKNASLYRQSPSP